MLDTAPSLLKTTVFFYPRKEAEQNDALFNGEPQSIPLDKSAERPLNQTDTHTPSVPS